MEKVDISHATLGLTSSVHTLSATPRMKGYLRVSSTIFHKNALNLLLLAYTLYSPLGNRKLSIAEVAAMASTIAVYGNTALGNSTQNNIAHLEFIANGVNIEELVHLFKQLFSSRRPELPEDVINVELSGSSLTMQLLISLVLTE